MTHEDLCAIVETVRVETRKWPTVGELIRAHLRIEGDEALDECYVFDLLGLIDEGAHLKVVDAPWKDGDVDWVILADSVHLDPDWREKTFGPWKVPAPQEGPAKAP